MNILDEDDKLMEESPLSWMKQKPYTEQCPFCNSKIWLRLENYMRGCTVCGAQVKITLGDLL